MFEAGKLPWKNKLKSRKRETLNLGLLTSVSKVYEIRIPRGLYLYLSTYLPAPAAFTLVIFIPNLHITYSRTRNYKISQETSLPSFLVFWDKIQPRILHTVCSMQSMDLIFNYRTILHIHSFFFFQQILLHIYKRFLLLIWNMVLASVK